MRILLDTHCWLWTQVKRKAFSPKVLSLLEDRENELFLSAASSWEIAIKYAKGRLPLPLSPSEYVPDRMESSGVAPLPVHHTHALRVAALPSHHRDPFDRLLIAQAQLEGLVLVTADRIFESYDVEVLWAR